MAILRQQVSFVDQLFLSGMVATSEREEMLEPLEERVRELHRRGAVWRPPLLLDVTLSNPPSPTVHQSSGLALCCIPSGSAKAAAFWRPPLQLDTSPPSSFFAAAF